jgi:hypothetical protein
MIGQSQLMVMGMVVEQRLAGFHAEAERQRLGRSAEQGADRRRAWSDLAAVAVVVALVLLLAANVAVGAA